MTEFQNANDLQELNAQLKPLSLSKRLALLSETFPALVFSTGFGTEDQLVTWAAINGADQMKIVTHLSGPLLKNTQTLRTITEDLYDIAINEAAPAKGAPWINGISQRAENADRNTPLVIWHKDRGQLEINPLADWSFQEVLQALVAHEVPINPLTTNVFQDADSTLQQSSAASQAGLVA